MDALFLLCCWILPDSLLSHGKQFFVNNTIHPVNGYDALALAKTHPGTDVPGDQAAFACELAAWRFHNRWWVLPTGVQAVAHPDFSTPSPEILFGKLDNLPRYIRASQYLSGEGLRYVFEELRRKRDQVSAAFLWQFNETWPNAAGNAIVDWFGQPRLTYFFVTKGCEPVHTSLRYDRITWRGGETFRAEVWASSDWATDIPEAETVWDIFNEAGVKAAGGSNYHRLAAASSVKVTDIQYPIPADYDSFLAVFCCLRERPTGRVLSYNDYLHSAHDSTSHALSPLVKAPTTSLDLTVASRSAEGAELVVKNTGSRVALFCQLQMPLVDGQAASWSENAFCLPPGAGRNVRIKVHSLGKAPHRLDLKTITCSAWNSSAVSVRESEK